MRACFCVPFFPGYTITVAPFFDGTNHPCEPASEHEAERVEAPPALVT
jgi:hypothetical protein